MSRTLVFALTVIAGQFASACTESLDVSIEESALITQQVTNYAGTAETYSLLGSLSELQANNAFFKNMGTTGRTCGSCHAPAGGWTPSAARQLWNDSQGTDPLFMFTHDVGLCPDSNITELADREHAMKLLLERGLTRSGVTVQPTWEFEVVSVDDPYACSGTTSTTFFGYRKPNPTVGVSQKSSVTWAPAPQPDMRAALDAFMVGATKVHGLTTYVPTVEEQTQGRDFMLFTFFAQISDRVAGRLDDDGARGGPHQLSQQPWFIGINDASTGTPTRKVFDIYDAWIDADDGCGHGGPGVRGGSDRSGPRDWRCRRLERRALIAAGQELFNFRQNANGGTCSGCHNSPNVGTRSVYQLFDIGVVDASDSDLPRVRLRNKTTGEERVVVNLGRAAATGLWSDIGRMAVPTLRGLASRAPYFSSGQAATLDDVVEHYDQRFHFGFTGDERRALVAFLSAL
jgi:cytochrome c peroxidase